MYRHMHFIFSKQKEVGVVSLFFGVSYSVRGLPVAGALRQQIEDSRGCPRGPVMIPVKEALFHLGASHLTKLLRGALKTLGNESDGIHVLAALVGRETGLKGHQLREGRRPGEVVVRGAELTLWLFRTRRRR